MLMKEETVRDLLTRLMRIAGDDEKYIANKVNQSPYMYLGWYRGNEGVYWMQPENEYGQAVEEFIGLDEKENIVEAWHLIEEEGGTVWGWADTL